MKETIMGNGYGNLPARIEGVDVEVSMKGRVSLRVDLNLPMTSMTSGMPASVKIPSGKLDEGVADLCGKLGIDMHGTDSLDVTIIDEWLAVPSRLLEHVTMDDDDDGDVPFLPLPALQPLPELELPEGCTVETV